ncbi:MAG: tRNA pseudouridine(13) synthase TruD [Phycisphaerae bacterium]|jgi:tRNA pseudouridine13 synthase
MTIRKQPDDFRVRETLSDDFLPHIATAHDASHSHALLHLTKTSLTTPDACSMLARALGVKAGLVAYAGLKDKHAHTTQHVTVPVDGTGMLAKLRAPLSDRNWSAELVGFVPHSIEAADIAHNTFTIVVRDLTRVASDEMARRADALYNDDGLLLINYFGDQRFAGVRGEFAAVHLMKGDFAAAMRLLIAVPHRKDMGKKREFTRLAAAHWGDWKKLAREAPNVPEKLAIETLADGKPPRDAFAQLPNLTQQMCVDAFQSFIWNGAARECVQSAADAASVIHAEDPFGDMLFPIASAWADAPLCNWPRTAVPMPGPDSTGPVAWMESLAAQLATQKLALPDLHIPGLRRPAFGSAPRPLAVRATTFSMTRAEPDELDSSGKRGKRTLAFSLPRGAYATVLLRALGQ